ncbi:ralBP1-associated Eps domain-containing protein 1-like isoform X2 [Dreissena polymorpha]|uniref:ralBP1-associated Eps domain-containing protein 1-like isoform X2 n=1 Tax=Dreissena polymorpha TaxID=45954 RepID=UPI002264346B|nr:ralBP1-associated Eps domain-containing protein 1-like isoform X2 [Dreissena polymorpha]
MLTEQEQAVYGELFHSCDSDGTGKISGTQAGELFRYSGLTHDVLSQITELCGAKRLGHFGRSQFYIALKLIAAAQCGLPVATESINSGVDIPLPKFHRPSQNDPGLQQAHPHVSDGSSDRHLQGQLPPPPGSAKKGHSRNPSGQIRGSHTDQATLQMPLSQVPLQDPGIPLPPHPAQTLPSVQPLLPAMPQSPPVSPHASAAVAGPFSGTTAPGPGYTQLQGSTSQVGVAGVKKEVVSGKMFGGGRGIPQRGTEEWARFESDDEKHGLLGEGRKEEWDAVKLPELDSSSYSSDTDSVEDVWSITDEQREYYVRQFNNIEHDLNGHISGGVAKEFFEKSKLSNQELSKIWNLSDLNRDGALSLEEFCIAMHLVVLRRNEIDIPDRLPFSLMPYNAFTNEDAEPFAADLPEGSTLKRLSPMSPLESQWDNLVHDSSAISSDVSSPSVTPANFDFQKPSSSDLEARIVQPKAVRLSPEMMIEEGKEARPEREPGPLPDSPNADPEIDQPFVAKQRANTATMGDTNLIDPALHSRPRPLAKRNTVPGALSSHILPPVPQLDAGLERSVQYTASIDGGTGPPAPPPRPGPQIRSMSVDYKAPPAVPPRAASKEVPVSGKKVSELKNFQSIQSQEVLNILPGSGHGQVGEGVDAGSEKKTAVAWDLLGPDFSDGSAERQAEFMLAAQRQASRDKRELHMAIRTHKERNSMLSRLNHELNQELQEVMEQRIALEIQLEHLRPFSS